MATGVCGLAAMLWLYGVAWHQPLGARSIGKVGNSIVAALPSVAVDHSEGTDRRKRDHRRDRRHPRCPTARGRVAPPGTCDCRAARCGCRRALRRPAPRVDRGAEGRGPADAARRATSAAPPSCCRAWTDLELGNAEAWRCLGDAQQALGSHQEALNAFRKAKQYDPPTASIDAAIDRSQKGIVGDFLNRYRK